MKCLTCYNDLPLMKHFILCVIALTAFLFAGAQKSKQPVKLYTITGTVEKHSPYCGGDEPAEGAPGISVAGWAGVKLYVRKGTVNSAKKPVILEFVTDEKGSFSLQLPAGNYCIIQEEKVKPLNLNYYRNLEQMEITSEDCLKQWWKKCHTTLHVGEKDITGFTIIVKGSCYSTNPCLNYTGPPPP